MSTRPRIVLYNPKADFYTMPLALLALGSAIDRTRYDVRIVDGRLDTDACATVVDAAREALCVGVTALTGGPLRDALRVTRAVRAANPRCPIVWGGWHPSLFPVETLHDAGLTATIQGQGELAFREVVDRLHAGDALADVAGCTTVGAHGEPLSVPARPTADINGFPAHDYALVEPERYFALKGRRQLDYVTSQGCRFRCTFCADPTVYRRAWFGLAPERVADELAHLSRTHGMTDVAFQDETFFTNTSRVAHISTALLARGLTFTWMATMRGDQGARLDEQVLALARRAGLRRVMVGLESGSQAMLDWMKKDVDVDEVFTTADKCRRAGIAMLVNLIVGFPGEPHESVVATLGAAKRLRAMGPDVQVAIFYYKPYPGTPITAALAAEGFPLPARLDEWAELDSDRAPSPWVSPVKRRLVDRFTFYQRIAWAPPSAWRAPVQAVARWRCKHDCYAVPVERWLLASLRTFAPQG